MTVVGPTDSPATSPVLRRRQRRRFDREALAGYAFISPWIIGFLLFTVISMSYSAYLSATDYDLATNTAPWVGGENYAQLIDDPKVLQSLGNTFTFTLMSVPLETAFALLLALLLMSIPRGQGFFRVLYYLPKMTPAVATIAFFHRALVFFAAHNITRITRLITDNGANYTSKAFRRSTCAFIGRHQLTRIYTPRHNGKIERYQRLMTDECLYARAYHSEDERREAIGIWFHHYNYHRPHTACGDQPPASRLRAGVDNVMTNYS